MYKHILLLYLFCNYLSADTINIANIVPNSIDTSKNDMSSYLQKALDKYNNIIIDDGVYLLKKPLFISKNNLSISGNGVLISSSKISLYINKNIKNLQIKDITIKNLGVSGGGYDSAVAIYTHKKLSKGIEDSFFYNLNISGFGIGINLKGNHVKIKKCYIHDTLSKERIGTGGGHGIYVKRGSFYLLNNKIENMQGGILASMEGEISNNIILNAFDDNGIYVAKGFNLNIKDNYIDKTKTDGIALNKANNVYLENNIIKNAGNGCIRPQESIEIKVQNNICISNGITNTFIRGYAKKGKKASNSISINNNIFMGPLSKMTNPIIFNSADTISKNIEITNNIFKNIDLTKIKSYKRKNVLINIAKSLKDKKPLNIILNNNQFINIKTTYKNKNKLFKNIVIKKRNIFTGDKQ